MEGQESESSMRDYPAMDPTDGAAFVDRVSGRPGRFDDADMQVGDTASAAGTMSATVTSIRPRADGSRPAMTREEALAADAGGAESGGRASNHDILGLLREYRVAESTSRRGARRETAMGETDLLAMRLLVEADAEGRLLTPGAIATALGISTASTTALIDRLSSAGFVIRRPHDTDRRSTVILPTVSSENEVREALGRGQASIARAVDGLSPHESEVVARFLRELIDAARATPDAR